MSNINLVWDPNTPPETLDRLYCDGPLWLRISVLKIPNVPQYIKDLHKFKNYLKYYDFT